MREAVRKHFEVAPKDAEIPHTQKRTINDNQRRKLYAKAGEQGWSEYALDRLCKEQLGYKSKNFIHPGDAFDEILEALEVDELRVLMERGPNTNDAFPHRPATDMPDIITGTVKYPANNWMDGKYGPYADAVFESSDVPDDEIRVYMNEDDDMSDALFRLEKGETYELLYKGDGKAGLQDSDLKDLMNRSNGQTGGSASNGGSNGNLPSWEEVQTKARLIGSAYIELQDRMDVAVEEGNLDSDKRPSNDQVVKAAISSVIR